MMALHSGRLTCFWYTPVAGADFCCRMCCPLYMHSCLFDAGRMKRPSLHRAEAVDTLRHALRARTRLQLGNETSSMLIS